MQSFSDILDPHSAERDQGKGSQEYKLIVASRAHTHRSGELAPHASSSR